MGVEEKYMKVVQDREAMLQFAACLQIFFFKFWCCSWVKSCKATVKDKKKLQEM